MRYLLDTNVFSELLKSSPDPEVVRWFQIHQHECAMSAITLAEMAAGLETLPEGKRRSALARELRFLQEDFAEEILPFDQRTAWEWSRYIAASKQQGFKPPLMDSLIAATAVSEGLIVVTRNEADFPLLKVLNPFKP
ncbi:MAG: PIN domain-containing protein [Verrucomicrobiaceae bacterium]|nr:PIN domain-containing protein [Verrucomicrobiaceae bacterium]